MGKNNCSNAFVPYFGHQDIMVGPQYQAIIPALCTHTFYERGECLLLAEGLWFQWSILHNRPAESTGTHACFVTVIPSLWKWGPVVVDPRCVVQSGSREVFAWSPEKREWQWTYKHSDHRRYSQRQWAGWVESLRCNTCFMQFGSVWFGQWSMLTVLF